jgi:tripartite ATP-independent transporter DctP family solute receptor
MFLAVLMLMGLWEGTLTAATRLKFATIQAPTQPYNLAAKRWGEIIEKETKGDIKVTLYAAGSACSNQQDCHGQLKTGSIDLSVNQVVKDYVAALQVCAFPYAFTSYEAFRKFMDSETVEKLREEFLQKTGIRILGTQYNGARHLTTTNKIVRKPSDLKGMKIRAVSLPLWIDTVKGLGALPTPIAFQELLGALKTGVADGQENPIPTIYQMKFYQAQKYIMLTGHIHTGGYWMMNEKKFQSFSPKLQKLMLRTAHEAILYGDNLILEQQISLIPKLKKEGMVFIGPEQGLDVPAFVKSVRSSVWPKYEKEFGKSVMDALRATK